MVTRDISLSGFHASYGYLKRKEIFRHCNGFRMLCNGFRTHCNGFRTQWSSFRPIVGSTKALYWPQIVLSFTGRVFWFVAMAFNGLLNDKPIYEWKYHKIVNVIAKLYDFGAGFMQESRQLLVFTANGKHKIEHIDWFSHLSWEKEVWG